MKRWTMLAKAPFGKSPGLSELAAKVNEIDVTDCTLEGARAKILELLDAEKDAPAKRTAARN